MGQGKDGERGERVLASDESRCEKGKILEFTNVASPKMKGLKRKKS